MMAYSHVIWDWNGTLLDDAGLCTDIMNKMLARRALPPITLDFYKAVIEFPVVLYYEKLGFDFLEEPFEAISDEFVAHYQAGWRSCSLQRGAKALMERLHSAGIGQSVLSASLSAHLLEQLEHFSLGSLFDTVTGADNHHGRGKAHLAAEHVSDLGIRPGSVVLVGDTLHDAEVAEVCGSDCILVSFGHYNLPRLMASGKRVAEDMAAVYAFIAGE